MSTISFRALYVFIVLAYDRRRILHFNVTAHPTAVWTAQQIVEAFPFDTALGIFFAIAMGSTVTNSEDNSRRWTKAKSSSHLGLPGTTLSSNVSSDPFAEKCLDHVTILGEESLRRPLHSLRYYHDSRLHLSLEKDSPIPRAVQSVGSIIAIPQVGGRHHRYERRAARIQSRPNADTSLV